MIEGWKAGLAAGVLAACLVTARGGILENARALLSAGKHGDVDVVLAPLLSQTPPSLDALLLSFEAAVADGRLYAAERRAMAVLDGNGKPSASFLHAAADVAGKLGKDGVRRDRLVYFLQVEPGATPQVRNALAELCSEGGDAAFFIRYVKAFGPDADALDLGLLCLLRQREG